MNEVVINVLRPEKWLENYADALYGFLHLRIKDAAVCEDLVQETFLSAWNSKETYNKGFSERTWLFAICRNKLVDHYRSLKRTNHISLDTHFFDEQEHWTAIATPRHWQSDQPIFSKEFQQVLDTCRRKLKPNQFSAFALKYIDGLDAREICRLMDISLQHYWVLIHRSKLQLRECLELNWINV
jgi:RNA polymerase sigma-70 factor (ECF subfamily)